MRNRSFRAWYKQTAAVAIALILSIALFQIPNQKAMASVTSPYAPANYKLAFSDDFNGTSLDTNVWDYRVDLKKDGTYVSQQISDNVSVSNGNLVIKGVYQDPRTPGYNSGGGVISKQVFKNGYYEARIKTQAADNWHSSFWTYHTNSSQTLTEIDVFERDSNYDQAGTYGLNQNVLQHSSSGVQGITGSGPHQFSFDPSADYHVYGMLWEENSVKFYVDGTLTSTISYPSGTYPQDYNNIFLSMISRSTATQNTEMDVDYVQYYAPPTPSYPGAIIVDNGDTGFSPIGSWGTGTSTNIAGYQGANYSYSSGIGSARFTPTIPTTGNYDIYVWYEANDNKSRSSSVPLEIAYNGGTSLDNTKTLNQTANGTEWVYVGTYPLTAGTGNRLDIKTPSTGTGIADAVMFAPSEVILDNSDSSYSEVAGTWYNSTLLGHDGSATRYSSSTGAKAKWTPNLNGTFQVYIYKIAYSSSDSNARIEVDSDNGATSTVTYQNWQTGSSGWVLLGTFNFQEGSADQINITRNDHNARTDAVKLVRIP